MICPRCGAENQPTAKICRMCATPLEGAAQKAKAGNSPAASGPGPNEILCSTCKAVNDATWAYCQQCGSQLHKMGAQQPMPSPAPIPPPIQNKPVSAPAPVSVRPPAPPPAAPTPVKVAPPVPMAATPGPVPRKEESLAAGSILNCSSCGRINTPGSSFCATCGAPLPAEQTVQAPAVRPPAAANLPKLRLIQEGGGEGEVYKLESDETVIGRNSGDIRFPHDGYMSGRHARLIRRGERYVLIDENSRNGTFKRIDGEVELRSGDIILIGKQLFRFEV